MKGRLTQLDIDALWCTMTDKGIEDIDLKNTQNVKYISTVALGFGIDSCLPGRSLPPFSHSYHSPAFQRHLTSLKTISKSFVETLLYLPCASAQQDAG